MSSGILNLDKFKKQIQGDFQLLLSSGLRNSSAPDLFFKQLLVLNQKELMPLSSDILIEFEQLATAPANGYGVFTIVPLPNYYNKMGEFYTHLFVNYANAFYAHFTSKLDREVHANYILTLLHEFYEEIELLIDELRRPCIDGEDMFLFQLEMLTLFNLYHQVQLKYSHIQTNNILSVFELRYKIGSCIAIIQADPIYYDSYIDTYLSLVENQRLMTVQPTSIKSDNPQNISEMGYLTLKEAYAFLSVSDKTYRKYVNEGRIKEHRVGGRKMVMRSDLVEFVKNRM